MKTTTTRNALLTRDGVLKLLTNQELEAVATAEAKAQLIEGDEYLDLGHLERGVRVCRGHSPMNRVLPRKSLHPATWSRILARLRH